MKQNNSPIVPVSSAITNVAVVNVAYSDSVTSNTGWTDVSGGFDGIYLSYGNGPVFSSTLGDVIEFTFPKIFTGRVRVWGRGSGDSSPGNSRVGTVTVNSQTATWVGQNGTGDSVATDWIDAGDWNTIKIESGGSMASGDSLWWSGIEVEGEGILTGDTEVTNLILQNASGLSDFEVGDVVQKGWNQSEVWSDNLSGSFSSPSYVATKGFDGNPATGALTNDVNVNMTYTGTLTNVTSLRIQIRPVGMGSPTAIYQVSGTGITTTQITGETVSESLVDIPLTSTTVSDILISNLSSGPESQGISQMEVNGSLLVDTGISGNPAVSITAIDTSHAKHQHRRW